MEKKEASAKLGVPFLGVSIPIMPVVHGGLCWGSAYAGKLPYQVRNLG